MYLQVIKELLQKQADAEKVVRECKEAISVLQNLCEHSWTYEGHGHNYNCYICHKCLARREE